jgi:hypothetical protein
MAVKYRTKVRKLFRTAKSRRVSGSLIAMVPLAVFEIAA